MTPQDRIDTGFAPWSLMTPDPAKARATNTHVQTASRVHEDKRAPEMAPDDGYMFGEDGMTFGDLLDIVNPLQHLPVIGAVYRSITGDEADPGAKMAGGAIYGGPLGFASAMINNAIEEHTGDDVMGHMLAMVGLGEDGEAVVDGEAVADASGSGTANVAAAPGPILTPGTAPAGAEAQLAAKAMSDAMNGALPAGAGNGPQLDAAQAAFLERMAARSSGSPGSAAQDLDSEPLDAILTASQPAAQTAAAGAEQTGKRKDYGGVARISNEMAQHLAMLAQAGSPSQALAQQAQAQQAGARTGNAQTPGQTPDQAAMQSASAKYSAALPLSIDGSEPAANPFAALQSKQDEPDPFETAMKRLGLTPPTMTASGQEDTQRELMEAAFPEQTAQPSQTASMAGMAGITPPSAAAPAGENVPSAMLEALNRYQAMKQQG